MGSLVLCIVSVLCDVLIVIGMFIVCVFFFCECVCACSFVLLWLSFFFVGGGKCLV